MRFRPFTLAAPIVALALLAACGDRSSEQDNAANDTKRQVEHAMGTAAVPAEPQRVVVLDSSFLDAALALGVTPVGATEASAGVGTPDYLADRVPDIDAIGLTDEPNLEAIAALRPDLILGAKVRHEELYDELADIAPTVFTESSGTNWKDGLAVTADALAKTAEAQQLLADHEARAKSIGEKVDAASKRFSMVRFLLPDEIRLYGPNTFSGSVLTDVGFDLGDHTWDEYSMAYLSAEQLGRADADVVFATSYGGTDTGEFKAAFATVEPVWKGISAVAEGRQHWVEDDTWMLGIGPIGAELILDDLESLVVEQ